MSFIRRNMIHTIAFRTPGAGRDVNGDPTSEGTITTAPARVEARHDKVRGPDGNEVVTAHRIYTATVVPMTALLWVPSLGDVVGDASRARRPLAVMSSEQLRGGDTLCTVYL